MRVNQLGALCIKYNTKLIVDGTQGFCAFPVSPPKSNVHAFIASGFKWMTAGYGVAVIYIDPEFRKELDFQAGVGTAWSIFSDHGRKLRTIKKLLNL